MVCWFAILKHLYKYEVFVRRKKPRDPTLILKIFRPLASDIPAIQSLRSVLSGPHIYIAVAFPRTQWDSRPLSVSQVADTPLRYLGRSFLERVGGIDKHFRLDKFRLVVFAFLSGHPVVCLSTIRPFLRGNVLAEL